MVILPAREVTNHAGRQLPPPDLWLPPHPSQPASQQRHSWLDLSQKRNFTQTLSPTQQAPRGQSKAGGSPLAGPPGACWIRPLQPQVLRDGVTDCPNPTAGGTGLPPQREPRHWAAKPVQPPRIASPKGGFSMARISCLPRAGSHASRIRSLDQSPPTVRMGGPVRRTPRSSVQPSPGVRCKAEPGGQRLLGVGRKPQHDARPGWCPLPHASPCPALPAAGCGGPPISRLEPRDSSSHPCNYNFPANGSWQGGFVNQLSPASPRQASLGKLNQGSR